MTDKPTSKRHAVRGARGRWSKAPEPSLEERRAAAPWLEVLDRHPRNMERLLPPAELLQQRDRDDELLETARLEARTSAAQAIAYGCIGLVIFTVIYFGAQLLRGAF